MNNVNRIFIGWVQDAVSVEGRIVQGPFRIALNWCEDYITLAVVDRNGQYDVEQCMSVERMFELHWVLPYSEIRPKKITVEDVAGILTCEEESEIHMEDIFRCAKAYEQTIYARQHLSSIDRQGLVGQNHTVSASTSWIDAAITDVTLGLKALADRIKSTWDALKEHEPETVRLAVDLRAGQLSTKYTFWREGFTAMDRKEQVYAGRILKQLEKADAKNKQLP